MATSTLPASTQTQTSLRFLQDLLGPISPRDFAVRCWDGTTWGPEPGQPARFTLVLTHSAAVRNMFWPPRLLSFSEAFLYDDFNVEGDMSAFCSFCDRLEDHGDTLSLLQKLKFGWRLWRMPGLDRTRSGLQMAKLEGTVHSRERDRQAISFHYVSNELFAPMLDPRMVYTCGVFADADDTLEAAQERKLDLICRKLRLAPGERFLDIGCGWGPLVIYAAKHYGAQAVGVTINQPQAEWARRAIREAGLESRCRIDLMDYRDIDEREPFDKIATLEVTEHFGKSEFPTYFQKCWRLLRPQGSLLLQQITVTDPSVMRKSARAFGEAYVFPDGELASATFSQQHAVQAGFEVRDLESLREHYPLTLRRWLQNLEAHHDEVVRATDEATYRMFRLYFAAGIRMGQTNSRYNLYQMLFVKAQPSASGYPLGRQDWYADKGK